MFSGASLLTTLDFGGWRWGGDLAASSDELREDRGENEDFKEDEEDDAAAAFKALKGYEGGEEALFDVSSDESRGDAGEREGFLEVDDDAAAAAAAFKVSKEEKGGGEATLDSLREEVDAGVEASEKPDGASKDAADALGGFAEDERLDFLGSDEVDDLAAAAFKASREESLEEDLAEEAALDAFTEEVDGGGSEAVEIDEEESEEGKLKADDSDGGNLEKAAEEAAREAEAALKASEASRECPLTDICEEALGEAFRGVLDRLESEDLEEASDEAAVPIHASTEGVCSGADVHDEGDEDDEGGDEDDRAGDEDDEDDEDDEGGSEEGDDEDEDDEEGDEDGGFFGA